MDAWQTVARLTDTQTHIPTHPCHTALGLGLAIVSTSRGYIKYFCCNDMMIRLTTSRSLTLRSFALLVCLLSPYFLPTLVDFDGDTDGVSGT